MQFSKHLYYVLSLSCILFAGTQLLAQQIDETYNQKIKEFTTDKKFLPASVLDLVDDAKIPSPRKYFGSIIGAPGVMHHRRGPVMYPSRR